ncbi:unnamed protein product [Prunus armeniaca]|uniref:Pentatricopeptide repeat-containing protein n=1 Tax=Prunus armeniaca TaxID=36596 RepID=A0A6J5TK27_PRUAR|nr:unnamed protein product [Prunus armeniaca]
MINRSVVPDIVSYNSLIYGLCNMACKSGKWEETVRLFRNLIDCGALPNIVTFNSVLDALCKDGKTAETLKLVEKMLLKRCKA